MRTILYVFYFKQETAYEMRISDWSSDVCSSDLWQSLRPIFQAKGVQRGVIARDLRDLRILRNRVAHYEPIIALPLAQRYASITTLTGWLSPSAATWIAKYSTWPTLYRSDEHTSELQSLMRISYAVYCLKKKNI